MIFLGRKPQTPLYSTTILLALKFINQNFSANDVENINEISVAIS